MSQSRRPNKPFACSSRRVYSYRPEADHLREVVPDALGRTRIINTAGQTVGKPELAFDLGEQQDVAIEGQSTAFEIDVDGLVGDG